MGEALRFGTYSMFIEKKHDYDWYEWCVFVDESPAAISTIQAVEYALHPTFPEPVRLKTDKLNRFALFSSGWGGFTIKITIRFEDGQVERTDYNLQLEADSWPRRRMGREYRNDAERSVYEALFDEKYRWRKTETIVRRTKLPERVVNEILEKLETENLARRAGYRSIDNKELWGTTAVIGIAPRYVADSGSQNTRSEA